MLTATQSACSADHAGNSTAATNAAQPMVVLARKSNQYSPARAVNRSRTRARASPSAAVSVALALGGILLGITGTDIA